MKHRIIKFSVTQLLIIDILISIILIIMTIISVSVAVIIVLYFGGLYIKRAITHYKYTHRVINLTWRKNELSGLFDY